LIENKVASASVTRGQLMDYYSVTLTQLERKGFLPDAVEAISQQSVCFIYLTPTPYTGMVEFQTLELDSSRRDMKMHVAWSELLDHLTPLSGKADGAASWFHDAGLDRVRKVIEAAKNGRLPDDPRRENIKKLMNDLKERLQIGCEQVLGLVFHRWSDQAKEQLFATGPARSAYVTLYLSYNGSHFPSGDRIQATGDISFEVASKHRSRLRGFLASKTHEEWCRFLGVTISETRLDLDKSALTWRFSLPEMATVEFLSAIAERLVVFTSVFREILTETIDPKAA